MKKGHIACDGDSKSEVVVPIIKNKKLLGVLDIDSPSFDNFSEIDAKYLESICEILANGCDWPN